MGLASALNTALTGLSASETTIDVVGNNLANANTVAFKQSQADFATQFLQTMSLGSAPTDNSGGTNPRQTGLGAMVAEVTPDFTQGTIQVSSSPTDLAIQGDGFFMVQGDAGERLYSRNGIFKLNAENQMVSITGQRMLGYGVDSNFEVNTAGLTPITIPLGSAAVAQATRNVYLEGQLSPTGDIATKAERIESAVLGNGFYTAPTSNGAAAQSMAPNVAGASTQGQSQAGGAMTAGATYEYRLVYANQAYAPPPPASPPALSESEISTVVSATVGAGEGSILLSNIPADPIPAGPPAVYTHVRIYRRTQGGPDAYNFIDEVTVGTANYLDTMSDAAATSRPALDETHISGKFRYYVTFATAAGGPGAGVESRVYLEAPPATINTVNGRVVLDDLPKANPGDGWLVRRIYRSLATNENEFHFLTELPDATSDASITDNLADTELSSRPTLDMDGPKILAGTKLVDVLRRDSNGYRELFQEGTLQFQAQKGGRTLAAKQLEVTATTTVQNLVDFMVQAMGIQSVGSSQTDAPDVTVPPGGNVDVDGRILLTGNNGIDNVIQIPLSGMTMTYTQDGVPVNETVDMRWSQLQAAVGTGAITDTVVYDSIGSSLPLRLTMVLENRTGSETTYRWFGDSADNTYGSTATIAVGTGTVTFDTSGNFKKAYQDSVNIYRDGFPTVNPLTFQLDFSRISGLATEANSLAVTRQDGSSAGTLASFIVGEDGVIKGVFSNGISRTLAQIRLARFANPTGLEQRGLNLFATGINSGLPVEGNPGSQGIGNIVAGAVELSNTDVGASLIELILASTMYRGNARVITTVQQMFDELMALRR
jgi:flagellar hook protein FlgE